MIAHVARLEHRSFEIVLHADGILLHARMPQVGIDHPHRVEWVVGIVIGHGPRDVVVRRDDRRQSGGDAVAQTGIAGKSLQAGVEFQQTLRRQNGLIVDVTHGVAAAQRCLAVAEHVPRETDIRSEVLLLAVVPGTAGRCSREVERGIGEQRLLRTPGQHRREFQRIALIHHARQLVAQSQGEGQPRQQLPLILHVERVIVGEEVPQKGSIGHIPGFDAGHIERLAVAVDIAAERSQQRIGGGQVGSGNPREIAPRQRRLARAHAQREGRGHTRPVVRLHSDVLRVEAELNVMPSMLPRRVVR